VVVMARFWNAIPSCTRVELYNGISVLPWGLRLYSSATEDSVPPHPTTAQLVRHGVRGRDIAGGR
jgi:hypothetical protein